LTGGSSRRYAIVSPIRNEARFIRRTLESVVSQTERPGEWVIVDDGSTDETPDIVREFAEKYDFITVRSADDNDRGDPQDRLLWAAEALAFNVGLRLIDLNDYDFVVKLDGDLAFDANYFSALLDEFEADPGLGIAGGYCYQVEGGRRQIEWNPKTHVRGPTKMYRRACFEDIGGIEPVYAWDALDEIKAQMAGWHTRSFDLVVEHLKATGSVGGLLKAGVRMGWGSYLLGYHPLFVLARGARLALGRPRVVGGIAFVFGWLKGVWRRPPRVVDDATMKFLRAQQMRRLRGLKDMGEIKSLLGGGSR
jgi:glycosyltransferase involved in cell wall biosynthesis